MGVNFEYNFEELGNNELKINGKRTDSFGGGVWDSIIINKSWIFWIISTFREASFADYNTYDKTYLKKDDECDLFLGMTIRDNDYSYVEIFPVWKETSKNSAPIEIPYLSWSSSRLMSEFIEPFLVDLSKFLTSEEKSKLPMPWDVKEIEEADNSEGKVSLKFVEEIEPKEYFRNK